MTDKIFDDFMRDKLRNHSSPVPAGIWQKIAKEQKRRPVGFFWGNRILTMGLLFAIVATIGGLIWWQSSNIVQQPVTIAKANTSNNQEQANHKQTTASYQQDNQNTTTTGSNTIDGDIDAKVPNNTATATKELGNIDAIEKNSLVNRNDIAIEKIKANAKSSQQTSTVSQLLAASAKGNRSSKLKISNILNKQNPSLGFATTDIPAGNSIDANKSFNFGELAAIDKNIMLTGNKSLPLLKMCMPFIVDCPSTNGNTRNDWYVEVYASPNYTFKTVKGGTASNAYLQKKDSTESMRVGYTAGVRITKNIGQHLLLKAGLQLSQINERFTLRTENERKTTTVTTTRDIIDASGNVTTVTETSTFTQIGYLERVSNNQYRSIELPIMLGYEFGNDKLKASINGGVVANLASWYAGKTLDTAYQSISLAKSSDGSVYNHSVGISLYGSISIIKPITERMDVFAEPYFRYSLSHLNSSSLGYTQRFSTAGISLGIRYKFNNPKQRY